MHPSLKQWSMSLILAMSSATVACTPPEPLVEDAAWETGDAAQPLGHAACEPGGSLFAPGEISLPERSEYRLSISADGRTAYYHVDHEAPPYQTIYVTHLVNGHWTPGDVAPFSGTYQDSDPFISPDGLSLYFSSIRPVDGVLRDDTDLYVVRRVGNGWGPAEHLGPNVNSVRQELYASVTNDGTLYFASGTFDSDFEIYRSVRTRNGYAPAENLGPGVNSPDTWEYNPWVSPDGRLMVFATLNRPDGYGLGDLYVSYNRGGTWSQAINLGPAVNTEKDEFHPLVSRDLRQLYFVRQTWNPFVPSDFYRLDTRCLFR
jgi:hypothetical protein